MFTMDKVYIDHNDIIAKYLRGQLTPEESVAFEEYLMDQPALIEQLELDSLLIRTMPEAVKSAESQVKQVVKKYWFFNTPLFASFATLLICVVSLSFVYSTFDVANDFDKSTDHDSSDPAVMVNIQHILLYSARGGDDEVKDAPVVTPLPTDRYFEISVQTSDSQATAFEIEIVNAITQTRLLPPQVFEAMPSGDIKLTLLSVVYPPGDYVVTAKAVGSQSTPETYYFSVRHN